MSAPLPWDFARRYTEAWCSQDPERVASFYASHGALVINDGPPAIGREAIAASARDFMTAFPDLEVRFDDLLADDTRVIYRWTLIGTNTGPGGTGRPVRISGQERWRFDADGLVAHSEGSFDQLDYRRQLDGTD